MSRNEYDRLVAELPSISKAISDLPSEGLQREAFAALVAALLDRPAQASAPAPKPSPRPRGSTKRGPRASGRRSASPSIVKDLDLRPTGKQAFEDFAAAKQPASQWEQATVAVYYLTKVIDLPAVDVNHVYTCFKDRLWRTPSNLSNKMQQAASSKGWLDTSSMENIRVTPQGENLVEHDLPRRSTPPSSSTGRPGKGKGRK